MKISKNLKSATTTQTEFGKCLGLSQQRVNQLVKEEVLSKGEDGGILIVDSLKKYYEINNIGGNKSEIDIDVEKALYEKARREITELKLEKIKNNLYSARTVEIVMIEMLSTLRSQLLGLPSKLSPQLEGKNKNKIYEIMTREIEDKLSELSEYTPNLFIEEELEDEGVE